MPIRRPIVKLIMSLARHPAAATATTRYSGTSPAAARTPAPMSTASVGASGTTATRNSTTRLAAVVLMIRERT